MTITTTLQLNSKGDSVREWQRILIAAGYDLHPYFDDGEFGEGTANATISWQRERGLPATGIVDQITIAKIGTSPGTISDPFAEDLNIKFIQAKNYQKSNRTVIDLILIHSEEAVETSTTALNVANWFAGNNAPEASSHYALDDIEIIQCVKDEDIAYHVMSANKISIGIEHAGFARQTRDQWLNSFGTQMLKRSAKLTASLCKKWNIPIVYLQKDDLLNHKRGITCHMDCTAAFKDTSHTDPGKGFPMDLYITWVLQCFDELG